MNTQEIDLQKSGQSIVEPIDGTPKNYNDLEALELGDDDGEDLDDDEAAKEKFKAIPPAKPSKKLNSDIVSAVEKIIQLKSDRTILNSKIKEIVEGLEAKGILRDALNDTIKKMEWTDAKRESYSLGCKLSGNALGIMEQTELFAVN